MRALTAPLLLGALLAVRAQADPRTLGDVVSEYVSSGLAQSLALGNQDLEVERSLEALRIARAHFLPELSLSARYTLADGGRQIVFPAGELFNPIYTSLNELLQAQGSPARFATIGNVSYPLQLPREQDTHLSLRQPLYAPALPAAAHAADAAADAARAAREAFARTLRRDITVSYLAWLRAGEAEGIVRSAQGLLEENLRVNRSLFENGKITRDQVLRAEAELLNVRQQLTDAGSAVRQARSYVNFLLNRPLETALEPASLPADGPAQHALAPTAADTEQALATRPELAQLDAARRVAQAQSAQARAAYKPTLAVGIDYGTEGMHYGLGPHYDYTVASLLFNWPLFTGGATNAQVGAARAAEREAANERTLAAQRIELEVQQAHDAAVGALAGLDSAKARAEAARAAFRIASRRRDDGAATQLEFLDARNELTAAELNLNLSRFALLRERAELDYARGNP